MVNQNLVEVFKNMPIAELKEFVEANEQPSFANDSNVRVLLRKYTRFGSEPHTYPISFALTEMYLALTRALYERLCKSENK